jgi:hypothetical protein
VPIRPRTGNNERHESIKWSSYTLRAAAGIQAEIERLNKALSELLQRNETIVTASNGWKNHAAAVPPAPKSERWPGGPVQTPLAVSKTLNGEPSTFSAFEFLDGVLFWGDEFSGSEPKITQYAHTYCLQGLKRVDSGRLLTQSESL